MKVELTGAVWRKSTHSGPDGNCVEVAFLGDGNVAVRDTKSRWGSCSASGSLSFSWRLILAPEPVLDYVVAHEAAHLVEMNHSARFWKLVRTIVADPASPRAWLKRHRAELLSYG